MIPVVPVVPVVPMVPVVPVVSMVPVVPVVPLVPVVPVQPLSTEDTFNIKSFVVVQNARKTLEAIVFKTKTRTSMTSMTTF